MMDIDPKPPDPPPDAPIPGSSKRYLDLSDVAPRISKKTITSLDSANASIEMIYSDPSLVVGGLSYSSTDNGPFIVHVSRTEPNLAAGTVIKPIKFGQFLKNNNFKNICHDGVKRIGRNKISVEFKTGEDANNFLTAPLLSTHKYSAIIPTFNITRMGLVRNVPTEISMGDFAESLELPTNCGKVLKARRLNRKINKDNQISWVPTQTVVVTFQGQYLPSKVFLFYTSLPVELYLYPTIQCYACCRFGHTKLKCRSSPRCYRCSKDHLGDSCNISENRSTCLHCSGQHFATSKCCPEQGRQLSIKKCMAQENISFLEASSRFPKTRRPFSEVTQENNPSKIYSTPSNPSQPISKSISNSSSSYIKLVHSSHPHKSPVGKSYNKTAHNEIINNPPSSLSNGCALNNNPKDDNIMEILLNLVINSLLSHPHSIPSNVANKLTQIVSLSSHAPNINRPMEFTEH